MRNFMNKLQFNVIGFVSIFAIASLSGAEKQVLSPLSATIAEARIDINAKEREFKGLQVKIQEDMRLSATGRAELGRLAEKTSGNILQSKVNANIAAESRRDEKDPNSRENAVLFLGDAAISLNTKPTIQDIRHKYDDELSKVQMQAAQFQNEQDNF